MADPDNKWSDNFKISDDETRDIKYKQPEGKLERGYEEVERYPVEVIGDNR